MPDASPAKTADVDTDRDSILAEMASSAKAAEPKVEAEPAPEPEPEPEGDPAPAVEAVKPAAKDPEDDKRLAARQREERQRKQQQFQDAAARKKIDEDRAAVDKERAEVAELLKIRARAKYDPVGALTALGITEDGYEDVGRAIYAASKTGAAKPENREYAQRALKDREYADELTATKRQLAELSSSVQTYQQQAAAERQAEKYMAGVVKAAQASADAPLLSRLFAKNADKAASTLQQIVYELAQETDEVPDAADVVATYEKRRRSELEELGIDVDEFLKTKPKTQSKKADEKPPARTLSNDLSTSTQVRRSDAMSEQEEREDMLREIAKFNASAA